MNIYPDPSIGSAEAGQPVPDVCPHSCPWHVMAGSVIGTSRVPHLQGDLPTPCFYGTPTEKGRIYKTS